MPDRTLDVIRRKLVSLVREDPAFRPVPTAFERWIAARFSAEEVKVLFGVERLYGERAWSEWLLEVLLEAGVARAPVPVRARDR